MGAYELYGTTLTPKESTSIQRYHCLVAQLALILVCSFLDFIPLLVSLALIVFYRALDLMLFLKLLVNFVDVLVNFFA